MFPAERSCNSFKGNLYYNIDALYFAANLEWKFLLKKSWFDQAVYRYAERT